MKLIQLTALAAIVTLGACENYGGGSSEMDFDSIKAEAIAAIDKAKSAGNEWRDSRKFLEQAEEAFGKGDMETAMKLASKAKQQGELAYVQAQAQADAAARY